MTSFYLVLGIVYVHALAVMLIALRSAPLGYEDELGFHEGPEPVVEGR